MTLAGGNGIGIIEAQMTVLVAPLRDADTRRHCGYVHLAESSNGIKMGHTVSDDLFSTGILPELFAVVPFFKDLELNLYSDICSCEGSSSARIIYLRAYQSVWDQVGVSSTGETEKRMDGGTKFIR